jgi:hypothetical protein
MNKGSKGYVSTETNGDQMRVGRRMRGNQACSVSRRTSTYYALTRTLLIRVSISLFYCLALARRQFPVEIIDHFGMRDHLVNDCID